MKKIISFCMAFMVMMGAKASTTLPMKGSVVKASDPKIVYTGRISFANPDAPAFSYPGTQIIACFEGTSLKMWAKPMSGYFMAQIDNAEPFKVSFNAPKDSVVTLATALPEAIHTVRVMYCVEGNEYKPVFRGFILDSGRQLAKAPALPERKIEFIGNSITCGYGNESTVANDPFEYETENHYYTYAALTARNLDAQHWVVARSGIGVYRNYNGPKTGSSDNMPSQYEYTLFDDKSERWDFSRYTPDVVCINLGTNDLSTNNYDVKRLRQAYVQFIKTVRSHYPKSKIVMLVGSMLVGKELEIAKNTLNDVVQELKKEGDKELYRFDFTPQNGDLKYGASWHPSLWQHQKMAGELTAYLRTLMSWF